MVCENNVKHPTVCMIVGCVSMEYNGDKVKNNFSRRLLNYLQMRGMRKQRNT